MSQQLNIQRSNVIKKPKLERFQQKYAGRVLPYIYVYQSQLLENNNNLLNQEEFKKLQNENEQLQLFINDKFQEFDTKITIMSDLIKQLEVELKNKDDKIKGLELEVQRRDDRIKQLYRGVDVLVHKYIGNWEEYCRNMGQKERKLRSKKNDYKKKYLDLQEQFSLLQMRQNIVQYRLRHNVLPLRLREYENEFNNVNNMNYEQLQQLEELIRKVESSLDREDIKRITKIEIKENDNFEDVCPICQFNLEVGEKYRKLGCNHYYHAKCIKIWLLQHNNCPVCKQIVIIDI